MMINSISLPVCGALASIMLSVVLAGCSSRNRNSYVSTCKDGYRSTSVSSQGALDGCLTHGGSLSPYPEVVNNRNTSTSSSRSSSRRKKKRNR